MEVKLYVTFISFSAVLRDNVCRQLKIIILFAKDTFYLSNNFVEKYKSVHVAYEAI